MRTWIIKSIVQIIDRVEDLPIVNTCYRIATVDDADFVLYLVDRISDAMDAKASNPEYVPVARDNMPGRLDAFRHFLGAPGNFIPIGERSGTTVSMAAVSVRKDMRYGLPRATLDHIAVDKSYEGAGEAESTLREVIEVCREKGVNDLKLPHGNDFPHMGKLYENIGGIVTSTVMRIPINERS